VESHKDLTAEIDALVQNSGKKKSLLSEKRRKLEIIIDKTESSAQKICGEFLIVTEEVLIDGDVNRTVNSKHAFHLDKDKDFIIEKYDDQNYGINREILKILRDYVSGVLSVASEGKITFPISCKNVFQCKKKQILVICETEKNTHVKELINDMVFSGRVSSNVDMESFNVLPRSKGARWAILELEWRVCNGESVVVSGNFKHWYELMPIVVIASIYGFELGIGRSAGQRLSIGDTIDINVILDHFMSKKLFLTQFVEDPYESIEAFKKADVSINSLVVFPSILHNFFQR